MTELADQLLRDAEIAAERRAAIVRVVVAIVLLFTIWLAVDPVALGDPMIRRQILAGQVILCLFGMAGILSYHLATRGVWVRRLPVVTATVDAVLILGNLAYNHFASDIPGNFYSTLPAVWVIPIALAATAVHYRPRLQAFVTLLYAVGLAALLALTPNLPIAERPAALAEFALFFGAPPNAIRIVMLIVLGLILVLVARQGRWLLHRAVRETTLRTNLTRYLPRELTPVLSDEAFAGLRAGRRLDAALLFVDIRGSSGFAENMDPAQLAVFISSFRRRVMRATARHGGVVDKFLGDGALVLFGVPTPSAEGDAARALACGRMLIRLMERWNAKRAFDPPLRVGVGIHYGEVFCGVVGQEDRLEFTVLGEPVNIAARVEQSTKALDRPLLASRDAVEAAGEMEQWEEVSRRPLRGVTRPIVLMAPKLS
jgi:adenylate cyclase